MENHFSVTNIALIVYTSATLAILCFIIKQTAELNKTRKTDLIVELHEFYFSKEMRKAEWFILDSKQEDLIQYFKDRDEKDNMRSMVSGFFQRVGFLTKEGIITPDFVFRLFPGRMVKKCWEHLEPVEKAMHKTVHGETQREHYKVYFEWLYNQCIEWEKDPRNLKYSHTSLL
jgi:hypothetical protein